MELTMEQQFKLEVYKAAVKEMSKQQLEEYLIEVIRQGMAKDNLFVHWAKQDLKNGII